ncbi:hypothetical protein OHA37_15850 [Streptomyces sp. NBC_00335]|uniref:hypothetical protein n=1 Tax=unclassified Streptomyces TaxID=2593676 RepID=UPI0022528378|nr:MULTISPECIES: hypothetical protein [unclassified Streptomyces]MCX5405356.1 hypothetical protein [Streptomyces sp. NBC_00086]
MMAGDQYRVTGAGAIGSAKHSGSGDIVAGGKYVGGNPPEASEVEKLIEEVQAMRQHLDDMDRAEIDAAVEELQTNPPEARFRRILGTFSGIATLVGEAGVPVIAAVKALLA